MDRYQPILTPRRVGRGYTLIEIIITLAILGVAMTGFYKLMFDQGLVFVEETREIDGQMNTRRTADMVLEELQDAMPVAFDTTNGMWFTYALPHKTANGQMLPIPNDDSQPFGAQNSSYGWVLYGPVTNLATGATPSATYTIRFIPGTQPNDTVTFGGATFNFGVFRVTNNITNEYRELGRVARRGTGGVFFWPLVNTASDPQFRSFTYYGATNSTVPVGNTTSLPYLWNGNERVTNLSNSLDVVFNDPAGEDFIDSNNNGRWDAMLFCQFYYMDIRGTAATGDTRDMLSRVNLVRVPIAFRNVPRRREL